MRGRAIKACVTLNSLSARIKDVSLLLAIGGRTQDLSGFISSMILIGFIDKRKKTRVHRLYSGTIRWRVTVRVGTDASESARKAKYPYKSHARNARILNARVSTGTNGQRRNAILHNSLYPGARYSPVSNNTSTRHVHNVASRASSRTTYVRYTAASSYGAYIVADDRDSPGPTLVGREVRLDSPTRRSNDRCQCVRVRTSACSSLLVDIDDVVSRAERIAHAGHVSRV